MDEIILPRPAPPFTWRRTAWGPALICPPIERVARHLFTTRQWALGQPHASESGWEHVASAMQVDPVLLLRAEQVHGCSVLIDGGPVPPSPADIIVVCDAKKAAAVRAADCAPIVIADSRTGAVAAAHAGWRGMLLRVPVVAVEALERASGGHPEQMLVAVGPSIGACCYEVGPEVRDAFQRARFTDAQIRRWFLDDPMPDARNPPWRREEAVPRPGRWFFDGWAAVREQLAEAGVPIEQIFMAGLCTASHANVLCSYRRDGPPAGRIVGAVRPGPLHP